MRCGMTLDEAKAWLRTRVDEGERCPCCTQFAKVYRRKVYATMARTLIRMWRAGGTTEWSAMPDVDRRADGGANRGGGDDAKLRYWGLIEQHPEDATLWRVTLIGEQWLQRRATIPEYACIFDSRLLRLEGDQVSIVDALGKKFDYDDLMAGV